MSTARPSSVALRWFALVAVAAITASCGEAPTSPRRMSAPRGIAADYGPTAVYQVEISSNPAGNGIWFWAELSPNGTGDYEQTDCIHLGGGHATDAAAHDAGTLSWSVSNGVLTMTNVQIIGGLETATYTIPLAGGHPAPFTITITSAVVPIIPVGAVIPGTAQVQVAP